jgi:hypothetical protein
MRGSETSSLEWIQAICDWLRNASSETAADQIANWFELAELGEIEQLIEVLGGRLEKMTQAPRRWRLVMQLLAARLVKQLNAMRLRGDTADGESGVGRGLISPEALAELARGLAEIDGPAAAHTLQILAAQRDEESIQQLAAALADSPPAVWQHAALALSPLWNAGSDELELFFDRLQYHDPSPITLTVLLDLANYAVTRGRLSIHPWGERAPQLQTLLQRLVIQLERLQVRPESFGGSVEDVQRILGDSVALCISLCHALGLIGEQGSLDSLRSALELSHRHIQVEAACALTRLGDDAGKQHLLGLAVDPVARRRVVAYAEELGIAEKIDEELREPWKLAESELCGWLAEPDKFGLPPTTIELIDSRTLYWPSYVEPRNCFLFKFSYQLAEQTLVNIGIAGPTTHAFQANLCELELDDVYAAFAGWDVEHEEIYAIPMPMLNADQRREADRLSAYLEAAGFDQVEPRMLTFMLGEVALLAKLTKDGSVYWATSDGQETVALPTNSRPDALSDEVVLGIYRGRKILRAFNV